MKVISETKTFSQLTKEEQNFAIKTFRDHEKEEFGDIYSYGEAKKMMKQNSMYQTIRKDGKLESVIWLD